MYTHQIQRKITEAKKLVNEFQKAKVNPNTLIGGNKINPLVKVLEHLSDMEHGRHPDIADKLKYCSSKIIYQRQFNGVYMNPYIFGEVIAVLDILDGMYFTSPKFFISHSSEDKTIVKAFVEKILLLGCGFQTNDIYCTLDTATIPIGEDFRNDIIENMRKSDYVVLMMSNNYRQSEICHNEVGAAWALQNTKRVLPFKFPNLNFTQEDLGVLTIVKQAASLTDKNQLVSIYEEWCRVYEITPQLSTYSHYVNEFVNVVNDLYNK